MLNVRNEYQPGVCNIGNAEKRMRFRAGWVGLAITVVLWILFIVLHVSAPWRLFLSLPAMLAASGFIQGSMSFCVNFGMRGVQNFGNHVGKVMVVEDPGDKKTDRRRSAEIIGYSALAAVVIAAAGLLSGLIS